MTNSRAIAMDAGMTMRHFAHQDSSTQAPKMAAPRNARSKRRRSTGRKESRRRYSCMAMRTVLRALELVESDFEGVWVTSVIGPQDYTIQELSPMRWTLKFDLRRTEYRIVRGPG